VIPVTFWPQTRRSCEKAPTWFLPPRNPQFGAAVGCSNGVCRLPFRLPRSPTRGSTPRHSIYYRLGSKRAHCSSRLFDAHFFVKKDGS
jgi:hypothetical protein